MTIVMRVIFLVGTVGPGTLAVKRKASESSLFEAYAMYPYGYYVPQYPMMASGPAPMPQPMPQPMGQPMFTGYPQPMPMMPQGMPMPQLQPVGYPQPYSSYYMQPPPPPQGFYQQPGPANSVPGTSVSAAAQSTGPASSSTESSVPEKSALTRTQSNPEGTRSRVNGQVEHNPGSAVSVPVPEPISAQKLSGVSDNTETLTHNPLKDALSEALNEASKQIDEANKHAKMKFVSFDDIDFAPKKTKVAVPVSLSDERVPIDDHILNWRELVGLPAKNPVMEQSKPVLNDGVTPMLEIGKGSDPNV